MEATYEDGGVVVRDDARQQLYDSSGFGEPLGGDAVRLTLVEAAYLVGAGKLDGVDGDGYDAVVARLDDGTVLRVYADLRDRGYYLEHGDGLFYYERGDHPANSSPAGRVHVFNERGTVSLDAVGGGALVAVSDDDGDVTYFSVTHTELSGDWDDVEDEAPTEERAGTVVADDADVPDDVLTVYTDLRRRGTRPRTGFKFGAAFRVYEKTDDEHAPYLISVLGDAEVTVRHISRYVRLAHGVRKTAVFALLGDEGDGVRYLAVERQRP